MMVLSVMPILQMNYVAEQFGHGYLKQNVRRVEDKDASATGLLKKPRIVGRDGGPSQRRC